MKARLTPRKRLILGVMAICAVYFAVSVWFGLPPWNESLSYQHAMKCQTDCQQRLQRVDRLQVWAAGKRNSSGVFCSPCSFGNPTVIYETSDPAEIESLKSSLSFSWSTGGARIAACGPLTVDFYEGKTLVLSLNWSREYVDSSYVSSWSTHLSGAGERDMDAWFRTRGLFEKLGVVRETQYNAKFK